MASCRPAHSASERSRYFSVTISRMGPTSCAMPPWTSTRLSCRRCRVAGVTSSRVRIVWLGSRRPRLMPYSGSPAPASTPSISFMPGQTPPESCQPPPEPPSHSPRMARAATTRRSSSVRLPVRERVCPVARMQHGDERRQQIGRDGQPRALGNTVDLAHELDATARANQPRQQVRQRLAGALDPRRHDARGDDRGLQQAQVILRKVEHLAQGRDLGRGAQVHTDEPQHGLVDDPEVGLDGRPHLRGAVRPAHAEVDGDVQHPGALREVHAQEENVAPAAVGQVHPHRRRLVEDGEQRRAPAESASPSTPRNSSGRTRSG